VAVNVGVTVATLKLMVPVAALVNMPPPARVVTTASVPLFVYVPPNVSDVNEIVPLIAFAVPLNVLMPVPEVNVLLLVTLPAKVTVEFEELFHVPLLVKSPVNVLVPVTLVSETLPLAAIVVAPATLKLNAPIVSVPLVPCPTVKLAIAFARAIATSWLTVCASRIVTLPAFPTVPGICPAVAATQLEPS
jgi:hypothetical protein